MDDMKSSVSGAQPHETMMRANTGSVRAMRAHERVNAHMAWFLPAHKGMARQSELPDAEAERSWEGDQSTSLMASTNWS